MHTAESGSEVNKYIHRLDFNNNGRGNKQGKQRIKWMPRLQSTVSEEGAG